MASLSAVAAISAAVYMLAPLQADVSRVAEACYGWPHDPARTVAACERLLARDIPQDHRGEALFYLGLAHDLAGDDAQALTHYTAAEALRPTRAAIFINRASIHSRAGRWADVIADGARAEALGAGDTLQWTLAHAAFKMGDAKAALAHVNRHITLWPDLPGPHRLRLDVLEAEIDGVTALDATLMRLQDLSHLVRLAKPEPGDAKAQTRLAEDRLALLSVLLELKLVGHAAQDWQAARAHILEVNGDAGHELLDSIGATLSHMKAALNSRAPRCAETGLPDDVAMACLSDRYMAGDVSGAADALRAHVAQDARHPDAPALAKFDAVSEALRKAGLPTTL